ncbi:MAG: putative acetyltransferase [Rhodothermales bacterium]|jgi:putative acetyltransferase
MTKLLIREDPLTGPEVAGLLREHLAEMKDLTPPGGVYTLDLTRLRAPDITFWSAWEDEDLVGCGALKELDPVTGEIKSMRTANAHQRKGVGSRVLQHIIGEASRRGYDWLHLETGGEEAFASVRGWYARHGFVSRSAFADYPEHPRSAFMTKRL